MSRDLTFWKEKLELARREVGQLNHAHSVWSYGHKHVPAKVRTWQYIKREAHTSYRFRPLWRRGKRLDKSAYKKTVIGETLAKIPQYFHYRNVLRFEIARSRWIKTDTKLAVLKRKINKLKARTEYFKSQILRLESK